MPKSSPVFRQFLTIICCNLVTLTYGLTDGWITINYIQLQSENTTLPTGPLSSDDLPLVISIANLGALAGNFAIVPISRTIGLKHSIHLFAIPLMLGSFLVIWAQNIYYLYLSRLINGFTGGAIVVAIPTLINYVSSDNHSVRGVLNSISDPCYNVGIIFSYFAGSYLSCSDQAKLQVVIPAVFLAIFLIFPEIPEFYAKRNDQQRAMKSRKFYSGVSTEPESAEFLPESPNDEPNREKSENNDDSKNKPFGERLALAFKKFQTPQAKRAFFMTFTSLFVGFLCGVWFLATYVTDIFNRTGSTFSDKNSSLLISFATLFTNLIYCSIVERFNRKTLYIASAIMTALTFFLFATYCTFWLKEPGYEWLPLFCFTCIILFGGLGYIPTPYLFMIEIFPKEIREIAIAMSVSMMWFALIILGNIVPAVLNMIGLSALLIVFGIMCLINAAFCAIFIPETRGKSYKDIMELVT